MEDKILHGLLMPWTLKSIHFLTQQKEALKKQNLLTRYYSTYLRILENVLVTTMNAQRVRFHHYNIKKPQNKM